MTKTFASRCLGLAVILVAGLGASTAQAQFGLSYNSPGLSIGVGQSAYYGGYYPAVAPVIVPRPVVVAPPFYGPRPYYGGVYGYRGGYGPGPRGGYYGGGPRGGYGYPHRPY